MDDLGLKLKRAREERGIALRDIATRTKISITALEALERGEIDRLPGGIFSRSVVRSYAAEVGLDPETTVENFVAYARRHERETAERVAAARPGVSHDDREFLERQRHALRTLRVVVVLVAVAGVALLAWQVRRMWPHSAAVDPPVSSAQPAPQPSPPPVVSPPATVSPEAAPVSAPASVEPPAPVARGAPVPRTTEPAAAAQEPPAPRIPAAEPTAAPPASTSLVLELTALADCAIVVVRDGGPAESQTLQAGGRLRLEAQQEVALTVGDGGAVTWRINGRPAKPLGRAGTEVSVKVTPANAAEFLR